MRCVKCHEEVAAAANFCGRCGSPLGTTCPVCGIMNSAAHRFCHACGAALVEGLARPALEGERKQITVLFADLRGSLELLADQDPEETRSLLDPILECMMEAVHGFEGTVNQVMGDGIMALFGAPIAHEDHALRACCAALRMQEGVARLREELPRARGRPVQIRVGLNSGEVVVQSIGRDLHLDYTAVGQATFLAARMEQVAAPGTIYVTGEVVRLAAACIEVKPLGPMPIKGLAEPMEVFE